MLYPEGWQGGQKSVHSLIRLLAVSLLLLMTGCQQADKHNDEGKTTQAFSAGKTSVLIDEDVIRAQLLQLSQSEQPVTDADRRVSEYYQRPLKQLLWIDYMGADRRSDSLLAYLQKVEEDGLSSRSFYVDDISRDLQQLRSMKFGKDGDDLNHLVARLEYRLTKACLRYCYGQRFGFINPQRIFNRLDMEPQDSLHPEVRYRGLFDMDMDVPTSAYAEEVYAKIAHDSIAQHLRDIQPQCTMYHNLKEMLKNTRDDEQRRRVVCNLERCRWRLHHPIPDEGKRIIVNIPAFHLYAYGADSVLDMRVVCGAVTTKTPQLTSEVEWMEVNPKWVIPKSILEKDVAHRAGDSAYFARNHYEIFDKTTHEQLDVSQVSRSMLLSGKYRVAQTSGDHNSLGRIVFRFKNAFSVFLHYTSSPGAFKRDNRAISHGCVRVQRPFELAQFVLDQPDEWLLDRIHISMGLGAITDRGRQYLATHRDEEEHKLIGYVPVKPRVPLYIIYYTLWPDEHGTIQTWPDVYGFDRVVWQHLSIYI